MTLKYVAPSESIVLKLGLSLYFCLGAFNSLNRNYPKFSHTYVMANSADPDQTAPKGAV